MGFSISTSKFIKNVVLIKQLSDQRTVSDILIWLFYSFTKLCRSCASHLEIAPEFAAGVEVVLRTEHEKRLRERGLAVVAWLVQSRHFVGAAKIADGDVLTQG